jgi:hypothetical protein
MRHPGNTSLQPEGTEEGKVEEIDKQSMTREA